MDISIKNASMDDILKALPGKTVILDDDGGMIFRSDKSCDDFARWSSISLFPGTQRACTIYCSSVDEKYLITSQRLLELVLREHLSPSFESWFRRLMSYPPSAEDKSCLPPKLSAMLPFRLCLIKVAEASLGDAVSSLALLDFCDALSTEWGGYAFTVLSSDAEKAEDDSESLIALLRDDMLLDPLIILGARITSLDMLHVHAAFLARACESDYAKGIRGNVSFSDHIHELFSLERTPETTRLIDDMASQIEPLLSDRDLLSTAISFLDNDLSMSATSSVSFVHRNTLAYRLSKIYRLTGFDLRRFSHASAFSLLLASRNR